MIQTFDTLRSVGPAGCPRDCRACTRSGRARSTSGSARSWSATASRAECYLKSVEERQSKFGGGRSVYQTYEAVYTNQGGERLGLRNDTWIRIERHKTAETKKYGETSLATWTSADVERFMAEYGAEERATERVLGRRQGRRRPAEAHQGPADADRRDRVRVAARHLPGGQQGRRPSSTPSIRSSSSSTSRACPSRRSGCTGTTRSPPGCSACRAPTISGPERCAWLIQVVHRLDGRRRPPRAARVPLPQVQLHRRRHVGARAR